MGETLFEVDNIPEPAARIVPSVDRFDWTLNNEDVVLPRQPATAVYENPDGQVVIRQEGPWDENDDPFVFISRNNLEPVILRLQSFLPEGCSYACKR